MIECFVDYQARVVLSADRVADDAHRYVAIAPSGQMKLTDMPGQGWTPSRVQRCSQGSIPMVLDPGIGVEVARNRNHGSRLRQAFGQQHGDGSAAAVADEVQLFDRSFADDAV